MAVLEEQLQKTGSFAVGPRFTFADIVLGLATNRWLLRRWSGRTCRE